MMKIMSKTGFMTAVATAIAAAASAAAQISSGYYLYASPQDTTNGTSFPNTFYNIVSFWKGELYIGDAKTDPTSEPFIFSISNGTASGVAFTSYHQSPTGWQNMWVYPGWFAPPGFTSPHSAFIPAGADAWNFNLGEDGLFRYKDTDGWYACPDTTSPRIYKINYYNNCLGSLPANASGCIAADLSASAYGQL